jgi:hypothetical protein
MSLLLLFAGGAQAAVTEPIAAKPGRGGVRAYLAPRVTKKLIDITRDDEEVMEIIISLIGSGILD